MSIQFNNDLLNFTTTFYCRQDPRPLLSLSPSLCLSPRSGNRCPLSCRAPPSQSSYYRALVRHTFESWPLQFLIKNLSHNKKRKKEKENPSWSPSGKTVRDKIENYIINTSSQVIIIRSPWSLLLLCIVFVLFNPPRTSLVFLIRGGGENDSLFMVPPPPRPHVNRQQSRL